MTLILSTFNLVIQAGGVVLVSAKILGNCSFMELYLMVNCKGFTSWSHNERAVKILKNDVCITETGQAVLEIFEFKVEFPIKITKIRNFANVSIIE